MTNYDAKREAAALHNLILMWTQDPDRDTWECPFSEAALEAILLKSYEAGKAAEEK